MSGIRICSNGTPRGTHIYRSGTNDEIDGIVELILTANHNGVFAKMTLKVTSIDAVVDGEHVEWTKEQA